MIRVALEALMLFWFISVPLLLLGGGLIVVGLMRGQRPVWSDAAIALVPSLVAYMLFVVGRVFEQSGYGWQTWVLLGVLIGQVILSLYLVARHARCRLLVGGVHVLILTFSLGAWFVSQMMITGAWL